MYFDPIVELQHVTPNNDPEASLLKMARVSSENPNSGKTGLIKYLIDNQHWSPFEMVNMCVQITCPRDISRQIIRHRTASYQEFSQRYATVDILNSDIPFRKARRQDVKNRQNSIDDLPEETQQLWLEYQTEVFLKARQLYEDALSKGIAKEVARAILPEGLTLTTIYMNANLRTWIHYYLLRSGNGTQKEHQDIALKIGQLIKQCFPYTFKAITK